MSFYCSKCLQIYNNGVIYEDEFVCNYCDHLEQVRLELINDKLKNRDPYEPKEDK